MANKLNQSFFNSVFWLGTNGKIFVLDFNDLYSDCNSCHHTWWLLDEVNWKNLYRFQNHSLSDFATVAAAFYSFAYLRRKTKPLHQFSNEAIIFAGVLSTAASVAYFGQAIDTGSGHFSLLFYSPPLFMPHLPSGFLLNWSGCSLYFHSAHGLGQKQAICRVGVHIT